MVVSDVRHYVGFVYVVGVSSNPVKVGMAVDVAARMTSLQSGCPDPLIVYYSLKCPDSAMQPIEAACHRELRQHHRHGEWFNVEADEAKATLDRVAPRVIREVMAERTAREPIVHQLSATYGMSDWSEVAVHRYRACLHDKTQARELALMNQAILEGAGHLGFQVFQALIVNRAIPSALWSDRKLRSRAERKLAEAINALAAQVSGERARRLLHEIEAAAA